MTGTITTGRLSLIALSAFLVLPGCSSTSTTSSPSMSLASDRTAPPTVVKREMQVNQHTRSTQDDAAIAVDPATGRILLAWHARRQWDGLDGVNARLFSAAGEPLTPEFSLHDQTRGTRTDPMVAFGPDGTGWAVWCAVGADGDLGSIVLRRYSADFATQSNEIPVNQITAGYQLEPTLAVNHDGHVLVSWTTPTANGMVIAARLFAADGAPLTDEFTIRATSDDHLNGFPVVEAHPDGGFILAWQERARAGAPIGAFAQRVSATGELRERIALHDEATAGGFEPSIAINRRGELVATWMVPVNESLAVAVRGFDANLAPIGPARIVAQSDNDRYDRWLSGAAVTAMPDSSFVIAYNEHRSGAEEDPAEILTRSFDTRTGQLGTVEHLTQHHAGSQTLQPASNARRLAVAKDGALLAAWNGDGGFDDDSAVHLTRIGHDTTIESPAPAPMTMLAMAAPTNAEAPIPPIWQPRREPMPPLPLGPGDGPDFGFNAIDFTGWTPPDPEMAVGPDHIVTVTNGSIAFFDKTGTNLFQDEIEGPQGFWGQQGATGFVFDPEVLYDPHSNRFFAMCCERSSDNRSKYLLAVSDDANPMGTWFKYRIDVTNVDNDIDSPNMGIDADVVYLSADFFGPDKYQVLMIEKAPLLSGGSINSREIVITGSGNQSMGLPVVYDDAGDAGYLLQSSEGTGNGITFSEVRFHAITNQLTNPQRVTVDVAVPTYSYPNQPPQQGTSNRPFLFEPRFWSCAVRNGSMWAVHHVNGSRARVRWYEFDMRNWPFGGQDPILRQWGELDYGGGIHTYFPSIAVDAENNATIFFSRSATNEFISIGRAFRRHDDALNTFRPMEFVKQSTVPYTGAGRWGDYSGTKPEPNEPGVFWGHHEWTDVSNAWRTWLARVDTRPGSFEITEFDVLFGSLLEGDIASMTESDDVYVETNSAPGFSVLEPDLMRLEVFFAIDGQAPNEVELAIESRISQPGGQATVSLRRWSTGSLITVGSYAIGTSEQTESFGPLASSDFVRDTDGLVEVRIKHVVVATFGAAGFQSFFDVVGVQAAP